MAIETDVLVIGAGPAGLSAAISLKRNGFKGRVIVLDKGRSPGSHVLSGCIVDPSGFKGVLTDEEVAKLPIEAHANKESFRSVISKNCSIKIPWVPPMMHSKGYPVASLTKIAAAMTKIAADAGAEVCTGYAVVELVEENGRVVGARTGEKGVDKNGDRKPNYLPSEEIRAKHVILAEGGCGILTEKLIAAKGLQGVRPQTYAVGVKELIEVPAKEGSGGTVMHTFGYPADWRTYGGGFIYHVSDSQVMVGYAYALDYRKSEIDVHRLFRRFKATKAVQEHIAGGKSVAYGAKVIPEGGYYSVPKPYAPGVLIIGDGAGLLDSLRIKGIHIAMQSGAAAAKAIIEGGDDVGARYFELLKATSGWKEMRRVRNVRAPFSTWMPFGVMSAGFAWLTFGKFPCWRVGGLEVGDAAETRPCTAAQVAAEAKDDPPASPVSPDRLTDVFMSGTIHDEDQPCHLKIGDKAKCAECIAKYQAPCTRFCPAEVYRLDDGKLEIDFSNCLHCKSCKIKCPMGNIDWTFPQGGDGPRYTRM